MATKKGAKKTSKPEVTLEQLIAVAEDFNSFMFTDPEKGIPTDLEYDELLAEVTETAGELEATDTISFVTAETLNALNLTFVCSVEDFDDNPADNPAPAEEDEPSVDDEEEKAKAADIALLKKTKDVDKMKTVAKAWSIRIPPPFYKDVAKLKAYLIGKLDGSAPVPEKKEKAPKVPKAPKEKKVKNGGIGGLVRGILTASKESWLTDDDDILAEVKKNYPDANTNMQNIMWYRYEAKKKGLIPVK